MNTLIDNDYITVRVICNESSHFSTLCFTGIGHAIGGIDIQSPEFIKSSNNSTSVFIIDKTRSWGNCLDFDQLGTIIRPFVDGKIVNAIGNSMGAFLAILASRFFCMDSVVAFVPQYSVSKKIIPEEIRYDRYVNNIKSFKFESLAGAFNERASYYILSGYSGFDRKQLDLFPILPNINKIYFKNPKMSHNVAQRLKNDGVLYDVIESCFMKMSPSDILKNSLANPAYEAYIP